MVAALSSALAICTLWIIIITYSFHVEMRELDRIKQMCKESEKKNTLLWGEYRELNDNFNALHEDYLTLQSDYDGLMAEYKGLEFERNQLEHQLDMAEEHIARM